MNVIIVLTNNNKTCLVHDEPFEKKVHHAEFNVNNYQIRLVFDAEGKEGYTLEYPIEHDMVQVMLDNHSTLLSYVKDGDVQYLVEIQVVFVERPEE